MTRTYADDYIEREEWIEKRVAELLLKPDGRYPLDTRMFMAMRAMERSMAKAQAEAEWKERSRG